MNKNSQSFDIVTNISSFENLDTDNLEFDKHCDKIRTQILKLTNKKHIKVLENHLEKVIENKNNFSNFKNNMTEIAKKDKQMNIYLRNLYN